MYQANQNDTSPHSRLLLLYLLLQCPPVYGRNVTIDQPGVPFAYSPLPAPFAATNCDAIVSQFNTLGRTTVWNLVQKTIFDHDTFEPEGMVRIGPDRYFVSCGEYTSKTVSYGNNTVINGTDRTPGSGFAHMMVYSGNGSRIADAILTLPGAIEYHPGGIDYDGEYIWVTIAQYRPNSTAHFVTVDPLTLEATTILHTNDHQGGVVHDAQRSQLTTLDWGSRNASLWSSNGPFAPLPQYTSPLNVTRNPSFYIDYQDCKFLGHPAVYNHRAVMLCGGVATLGSGTSVYNLGGIALVDTLSMVPLAELPITMISDPGVPVTQNPIDVDIVDGKLRFYFLPDQHNSTLYVYEAVPNSPYEY
jgi:hypothetical protein